MHVYRLTIFIAGALLTGSALPAGSGALLQDFVDDYRNDPHATTQPFAFDVTVPGEGTWTIASEGGGNVVLTNGATERDGLHIVVEPGIVEAIHAGRMGVLAAAGKAWASDSAPFDFRMGPDPALPDELLADLLPFITRFWTRGYPEITPFGPDASRVVHGAQAAALYYTKGLRTAWYGIVGDQHVNAEPEDQVNPFDTLIFVIGGTVQSRLDGEHKALERGRSVHIPAGMRHEFWNDDQEIAEFIIVMFGEGA